MTFWQAYPVIGLALCLALMGLSGRSGLGLRPVAMIIALWPLVLVFVVAALVWAGIEKRRYGHGKQD